MKKKLLIATHSVFADGIKNAMELVTGEQNSVSTLCAVFNFKIYFMSEQSPLSLGTEDIKKLLMRYVMTKN